MRRFAKVLLALILAVGAVASAQSLSGFLSPGELASPHAELDGITKCLSCHEVGSGVSADRCMACHEAVQKQVTTRTGFHADKGKACESCHPDHLGRNAPLIRLNEQAFDHDATGFSLRGAHADTTCEECHTKPGTWTGLGNECIDCHADDEPHGREAGHPWLADCERCHTPADWDALPLPLKAFDHDAAAQADFPLHGQHNDVPCEDCHKDWRFAPVAFEACTDCHDNVHGNQFEPRTCDTCHTVDRAKFALRDFNHDKTQWPLSRPHRSVQCEACHGDGTKGRYVGLPHSRCDTCHADPHKGQFAPRDCNACHAPEASSFALSSFDHDATSFPLHGAHQPVTCEACHGDGPSGSFTGLDASGCDSCHDDAHAGRFQPTPCADCHVDIAWDVERFDHALTAFPLDGAHDAVECAACHGEGDARVLAPLPHAACTDCHADDDPHEGTPATRTCTVCHTTADWASVQVDHGELTGFPLAGKHAPVACTACHDKPSFVGANVSCSSCHEPDRPTPHFEGDCASCHQDAGWRPASLGGQDHAVTGFTLRGAHTELACRDCHRDDKTLEPTCQACHADDEPHRNMLGNQCDTCHSETDWWLVRFNHATTGWPLRGAHAVSTCSDCHATGYIGTPTACRRCHEADKPGDALHADPLTATCDTCHRPYAWEPARWPTGGTP